MGTWSMGHWLVVLLVIALIFGTKKLTHIGADLGKAVRGFKDGLKAEEEKPVTTAAALPPRQP